ncbi:MAG: glucuronate isomerase [Treponema sp.]|jgi:glucuronate isomerase|nr:glucuronate isomerase [Treponema sp.]
MPKPFMDEDFLLETETGRDLYKAVRNEPVYDYHCHLLPAQIAENINLKDLTEAWLSGDHYKWRMMRACGTDERYITGDAENYEKYLAWVRTVENLIGNPLYHWTHLELRRYFGIHEPLTEENAQAVWEGANSLLQTPELSVRGIFERFNIHTVGTTDDPVDSLEYHRAIAEGTAPIGKIRTRVIPSFRPDAALNLNAAGFADYIEKLSRVSGVTIKSTSDVIAALEKRLDYFVGLGCRSSDHALQYAPFTQATESQIEKAFKEAAAGKQVSNEQENAYKTSMLISLAGLYARRGIVMQLHLSAVRDINTKAFNRAGANTGYDAVNDRSLSENLSLLLDRMESGAESGGLPKTILYSLNPKDYYPLATVMGGFQETGVRGKMQMGCAWWFCDHRDGMEKHLRVLANLGILPLFVGMLTDSRSFLSYPRHEYFRRILCNLIGKWVENGEYPPDRRCLERIVSGVSFENARAYFG